ncbi:MULTISPECIES: hypothetical protein [unclassified Streptomyces]|uniref:hypothetical protein n=1 Tax=unclassified Streptomyces TaxID=2593676 RepID=UPI001BE7B1AF|nr:MULTISPECIES: hypothetical protein [unclassified Streptomyces]MBT2407871.1 hypothetical protein [Streptomyces sp. ISL-21]MBT2457387.1 hypothetical protein [Streptomyces sp. ISL-86]MBT2608439.1 hypothetical protein [Streptomyces sp. ISL-87]
MEPTLLVAAIVLAGLVIRTALAELREPGSARYQWAFLSDARALWTGAVIGLVLGLLGWQHAGGEGIVWAAIAALLAAFVAGSGRGSR